MITLTVDQRSYDGALQVGIQDDETGVGYRIAGPQYDGSGKTLLRRKLTKRDADEICAYLRKIKPDSVEPT